MTIFLPFIIITISSLAGYIFFRILSNKVETPKYLFFFISEISFATLILLKKISHKGSQSLSEAFDNGNYSTVLHFVPPCAISTIVVSLTLYILIRKGKLNFITELIYSYISGSVFTFLVMNLFVEKWTVNLFLIVFLLAFIPLIISLIKPSDKFAKSLSLKEKLINAIPFIALFFMEWIFCPEQLFWNNTTEILIDSSNWEICILLNCIIRTLIYSVLFGFLNQFQQKCLHIIVYVLLFGGYIQQLLLNSGLSNLDGTIPKWSTSLLIGNILIWSIILALVLFTYCLKSLRKSSALLYIAGFLCLIQLFTTVVLRISADIPTEKYMVSREGMFQLNEHNNVIIFVLDTFDEQYITMLNQEDPHYLDPLKDFKHYNNCCSEFSRTAHSMPYLLSNVKLGEGMTDEEYCKYAYENSTLLQDISAKDYKIKLYTDYYLLIPELSDIVDNYCLQQDDQKIDWSELSHNIKKSSCFTLSPYALKGKYYYTSEDFSSAITNFKKTYSCADDLRFYSNLNEKGITIDTEKHEGSFILYHMYGSHIPAQMNEELAPCDDENGSIYSEAKGSLKIVYAYLEELKKCGLYDDSYIIITADHGQNAGMYNSSIEDMSQFDVYQNTVNPICFEKKPYQTHDQLTTSNAPITHHEIIGSYTKQILGEQTTMETLDDIPEDMNRTRTMIVERSDVPHKEYTINGPVLDPNSWNPAP